VNFAASAETGFNKEMASMAITLSGRMGGGAGQSKRAAVAALELRDGTEASVHMCVECNIRMEYSGT